MNANLFPNAFLNLNQNQNQQDSFATPLTNDNNFAPWDDPFQTMPGMGFQNDGSQMQNVTFPSGSMGSSNFLGQGVPPGLFAAISGAIAQYFGGQSAGQTQPFCGALPSGASPTNGGGTHFQQINLSSTGDPHDAINGTTSNGMMESAHWDNMQSHRDLLCAPSIAGGFQLSSQASTPNAQGVTMNQSITATMNNGQTALSLNANGTASLSEGNITTQLAPNQTITLNPELSVTDNGNSLIFNAQAMNGGNLQTTLSTNGQGGVDVNAQGNNIALGGYLVNAATA